MKDKISKLKNLVKKYGLAGTIKKAAGYIYSNYLVKLSVKERIYVAVNKKKFIEGIDRILSKNSYDRIVIWRSSFGWDVPLYQRPQHIFSNFAKQRTLVFYEVTRFTDDVKRIKNRRIIYIWSTMRIQHFQSCFFRNLKNAKLRNMFSSIQQTGLCLRQRLKSICSRDIKSFLSILTT